MGGVRPSVRLSVHPLAAPAAPAPAAWGRSAEGGDAAGSLRVPTRSLSGRRRQRAGPLCLAGQRRTPRQQAPPGARTGSPPPEHPLPGAAGREGSRGGGSAPGPPRHRPRRGSPGESAGRCQGVSAGGSARPAPSASLIADRHRGSHHYHGHCLLFAALLFAFRSRLGQQVGRRQRGRR